MAGVGIQDVAGAPIPLYKPHGLNFSPYIDADENPEQGTGQITPQELRERLEIVTPYTEWIRTYGCDADLRDAGRLAHDMDAKAALGAWLSSNAADNQQEIDCLIKEAMKGHVDLAIVGSEVLLRGDLSETQLIAHITEVRQAFQAAGLDIPVTTADRNGILLNHPALLQAVDVVMVNYYPYWEARPIDLAVAFVHQWHRDMVAAAGGKEVIVSETGWPSCGDSIGEAVPSAKNAGRYFLNFVSWARANAVKFFYFEALDEGWKVRLEGPQGACWGIWDRETRLKAEMEAVFNDETVPDNWSDPPPAEAIIDFRTLPFVTETNLPTFLVASHVEAGNSVLVNGVPLPPEAIDLQGNLALVVPLVEGENVIEMLVESEVGESIGRHRKTVTYDPSFSTLDQQLVYVDIVDVDDNLPELSGTIVVSLDRETLLGIFEDQHVRGLAPDAKEIYMHDNMVIGTEFHDTLRMLPFGQEIPSNAFLVAPDGKRLYSQSEIAEVETNELLADRLPTSIQTFGSWASAPIPGDPAISADGRLIYCCSDVVKIDTQSLEVLDTRGSSSAFETDIAISPRDGRVLVVDYSFATGRLKAYDPSDLGVLLNSVTGLGDFAGEVAFSSSGDRAVVSSSGNPASFNGGRLSVIDLKTWTVLSQQSVQLADNLVTLGNDQFIVSSGNNDLFQRIGIQTFQLKPDDTLERSKTFFLGVNRFVRTSGKPKNDRIRKLVIKPGLDPPCLPNPTTACLQNGRFEVRTEAYDHGSPQQLLQAEIGPMLGDQSFVASFFNASNKEQLGKIVDGCSQNGHYWFFMASTTDVELTTTVRDTASGLVKRYHNADFQRAPVLVDPTTFSCTAGLGSLQGVQRTVELVDPGSRIEMSAEQGAVNPCMPKATTACLQEGRFEVRTAAYDHGSPRQQFQAEFGPSLGDHSFVASFFSPGNKEQLGKVLDGCGLNGHYWFFMASTTDVEFTTSVRDTLSGLVKHYHNADFQRAPALTDTVAFPCTTKTPSVTNIGDYER